MTRRSLRCRHLLSRIAVKSARGPSLSPTTPGAHFPGNESLKLMGRYFGGSSPIAVFVMQRARYVMRDWKYVFVAIEIF
jgi:hypothetical protein